MATPFLAMACATDDEPPLAETDSALTSVIPASTTCNQGVGAGRCVQAPPFESSGRSRWIVDGARSPMEYAGAVTLPFKTDDAGSTAVGLPTKIQATGTVHLQRVTVKSTLPLVPPRHYLYVFLEDIAVRSNGVTAYGKVNVYIDNARFDSPDTNVHAEDRRYVVDLASGTAVTVQQPSGTGIGTSWSAVAATTGTAFAAGGCMHVATGTARCKGELRIPLDHSATVAPAAGLAPGVGFMARTVNATGMSPDLAVARYLPSDYTISDWQTVLFTRPRGFDLAITTWNVRRFEPLFQSAAFAAVDPKHIGKFLAGNDIVAIQEGWDRAQVKTILDAANAQRGADGKRPFFLYGPIDHEPSYAEVITQVVDGVSDTQGGLYVMSHLPLATKGYHVFSPATCRGEDCFKAKGVQWVRLMLQDPAAYDPTCTKYNNRGCNKPPSGDDFVDVFNTHLQADEPLLCKGDDTWAAEKAGMLALLASVVDPVLAIKAVILTELVEADLNCPTLTDAGGRRAQLAEMNTFISAVAAPDRSSLVMGDFNVNGKLVTGAEYRETLVALQIAPSSDPGNDLISVLPAGGFDVRHGDLVRERIDIELSTGACLGTYIEETGGTAAPACTFAGGVDAPTRLDYIFVRPPVLATAALDYPRWYVQAVKGSEIWTSPFPSLSGLLSPTPLRLSDHKPVRTTLSFARLANPPKYNPSWRHTAEQRIVSVDATNIEDCIGCGEVDPFAKLLSTIVPTNSTSSVITAECTDNQHPIFKVDACMANWVRTRPHTPPTESAVSLLAVVRDDDNTSANDLLSEGTTSTWNYAAGTFAMSHRLFGQDISLGAWPNFEAVPMSRCAGIGIDVCHALTLTPIPPGQ
ncbi:MAG: endonuclease/exonuclease/phosphatase family protein [Myxococcota bacterium]|nr:endonuclease/exonuclease/phosphatase family protein [Myxococcota bacterium]